MFILGAIVGVAGAGVLSYFVPAWAGVVVDWVKGVLS